MKKFITIMIATIIAVSGINVSADNVLIKDTTAKVYVNGNLLTFDQNPIEINDNLLVPMRKILEAFGAELIWDDYNQAVLTTLYNEDKTFFRGALLSIGSKTAYVNDKTVEMNVAPVLYMGTTMIPLRFIAENFNLKVDWNEQENAAYITKLEEPARQEEKILQSDGTLYIGEFKMIGDVPFPDGFGRTYSSDGSLNFMGYTGESVYYYYFFSNNFVSEIGFAIKGELYYGIDFFDYSKTINGMGYMNGPATFFWENGNMQYQGNLTNGAFEGAGKSYDENGTLRYDGNFKYGLYNGLGKLYDENGNWSMTAYFVDGKVQSIINQA
ncbi:MAG: stalk domain-containing protein [Bacillota bacterium]|nr:stalk domain-containing protein [Bacillota bacterium]